MEYLITLLIIGSSFLLGSYLVKGIMFFLTLFFLSQICFLIALIIAFAINSLPFIIVLSLMFISLGVRMYLVHKYEKE